jgi:hypothetical protein
MYPPFGKSNIYIRVSRFLRESLRKAFRRLRQVRLPRPTMGKVWLRLSYFEERLTGLDDDDQEIFIENFYHSMRQVNYMTLLTVIVIIAVYLTTFQMGMIGFWEGLVIEGLLVFTLFYMVWYYRLGMEDLLDYLVRTETTPDYAFRPRLAPAGYRPAKPLHRKKARKR